MKGIILAGGNGTRLYPLTRAVSKQLLPVYDKPMIFYPLSTLMLAGIRDILVITTPQALPMYQQLLGDGSELGLKLQFKTQETPGGLAEAFLIGREFVGSDDVTLILGDNLYYGHGLADMLQRTVNGNEGATVFSYYVKDPWRYCVAEFDRQGLCIGLEEKPKAAKSNFVITGLYIYDNEVLDIAARLKPSPRGELEITDVNRAYLAKRRLKIIPLSRGAAWLDTGTPQSLLEASNFIATVENRQGLKIACLEEIAYRMGYIDLEKLATIARQTADEEYRAYFEKLLQEGRELENRHHRLERAPWA